MYHLITGLYAEWTKKERFNVLVVGPSGVGKSCLLEKIKSLYLKRPALPPNRIAPTVGQNVLELPLDKMTMHFWDLGGSPSVRRLWTKYYDESDAVVWVVDAGHFLALHSQSQQQRSGDVKGKGKATEPDVGTEAYEARELSWKLLSELLKNPSLEGCPILIVANKANENQSTSTDLASTVKQWFAEKLARIDDDPDEAASAQAPAQTSNVFADNEEESYRSPTRSHRNYEWGVILTSALEGTGVYDAVDWLQIRAQGLKHGRSR
ncbi:Small GTPase superfamily, ARF/SAR type [Kalmanozyma brasiliensis GHG001]|uniref:Small GTPase-RAS protein n=1 Tax=Kalmanozyma brasiliensis (strain GHG001) TaxID=1365824 RepID=V5EJ38_KALBG|nr:Small GTPase superfamily, ARF/SAR type [Kalmanozyma brasiliensis GHG001]EST04730.1 Small GTPase superfamily, ARF/SAR type [Kalmanozyma brasiliensis GHG001]